MVVLPRPWHPDYALKGFENGLLAPMTPELVVNLEDQILDSPPVVLPIEFRMQPSFRLASQKKSDLPQRPTFRLAAINKVTPTSERPFQRFKSNQEPETQVIKEESSDEDDVSNQIQLNPSELDRVQSALPEGEKLVPVKTPEPAAPQWKYSEGLVQQLHFLQQHAVGKEIRDWIDQVIVQLEKLETLAANDEEFQVIAAALIDLSKLQLVREPNLTNSAVAAEVRRASYAVLRRSEVWRDVSAMAQIDGIDRPKTIRLDTVQSSLIAVEEYLKRVDVDGQWEQYLRLDQIRKLVDTPLSVEASEKRSVAREFLSRLNARHLTASQVRFLEQEEFQGIRQVLTECSQGTFDAAAFLSAIESFESSCQQSASVDLARHVKNLQWFQCEQATKLSESMESHYRNANVRLALTRKMLEYLLPIMRPINEPVADNILGASVSGKNSTWTELGLVLIPDSQRIRFRLTAIGRTEAKTVTKKGPVRIHSQNNAQFAAGKDIVVEPDGLRLLQARANASGRNRLIDIETDYDQIPILGWVVRQIAKDEHNDIRGRVRNHVENKISNSAKQRLNEAVSKRLESAQKDIDQKIVQPLNKMNLDLKAIEMKTSSTSAVVRCRLAGPHQLAGYTARPRAVLGSLLSLQMHHSAINNLLQQVHLDTRRFELEELIMLLDERLGIKRTDINKDIPEGVSITLAEGQPIGVEFSDDRALVTIRLAELRTKRRIWRNFSVRARYRANLGRTHVQLERDGGVELISERLGIRDQIALRGIFIKVLSTNHRFQVIQGRFKDDPRLANLRITQFVARDGWVGISVGLTKQEAKVATKPTTEIAR